MSIAENIARIKASLPEQTKLIAVSKTKPAEIILEAYHSGQRAFGENKVQEMVQKSESLPADIEWHFIGHLQSNKVKYLAPFVHMIHAVDSLKLLKTIDREAAKCNRVLPCLLQFHIAQEESKFGMDLQEASQLLSSEEFKSLNHVTIAGVMGMATFTENQEQVRSEFRKLRHIFNELKKQFFAESSFFNELSMGMSDDFMLATEEGSTMVRIGSTIFGAR